MKNSTVTIIGSSGLIGGHLLGLLEKDPDIAMIRLLVRRADASDSDRIQSLKTDFSNPDALYTGIRGSDAVFCSVGTTSRKVKGDKEAYRKVDYDIPVQAARAAEDAGVGQFLLVSSVGASSNSNIFYSRLKGEVEGELRNMHIPSVSVFRPSLLLGKREEFRLGERIAQLMMPPFSFAVPSNFKPIQAVEVAGAMVAASKRAIPGFTLYHYREMKELLHHP
jgi:uncharacterized protein YbjT (DUF2867 family)